MASGSLTVESEARAHKRRLRIHIVVGRVAVELGRAEARTRERRFGQRRRGQGRRRRRRWAHWLNVIRRCLKVYLYVRLDDADCLGGAGRKGAALGAHLDDADVVLLLVVKDPKRLALGLCEEEGESGRG